ncbi:MAG TPA: HAD family hydrolase [Pseudonocardiaceae bacterium]|nr:HAD family hydrolase [Pseudonocardiaceae bacterium]
MRTEHVRHVVWDWNGTILDDNDAAVAAVNAVCAAYGRAPVDLEHWRSIYRRPIQDCYADLFGRAISAEDWADIDRRYHDAYRALLATTRLSPGIPDELRRWRAAGGTQSLLSMWFHDELVPMVSEHGLAELFLRVDGLRTAVGGHGKTDHLREHLAALDLDPADVLLVGDVLDDAVAAEAVGTRCVLVATGMSGPATLRASGVPVVDSVAEALLLT